MKNTNLIRCAIYTRKSTEEGLDMEFNSLDAQRESRENYSASQKEKRWFCLPTHYDDGGYSGGNIERPALKQLLADIKAGKIEYRLDKTNIIHCPLGKVSFTEEQLQDNYNALMDAIQKAKPSALKGQYLRSVSLATTMGPGVKINTAKLS